jgi:hypothetical protein
MSIYIAVEESGVRSKYVQTAKNVITHTKHGQICQYTYRVGLLSARIFGGKRGGGKVVKIAAINGRLQTDKDT